jgi:hypothetical protein
VTLGDPEGADHRVTDELLDRPLLGDDLLGDRTVVGTEDVSEELRLEPLTEGRGVDEVDEEHADQPALALLGGGGGELAGGAAAGAESGFSGQRTTATAAAITERRTAVVAEVRVGVADPPTLSTRPSHLPSPSPLPSPRSRY